MKKSKSVDGVIFKLREIRQSVFKGSMISFARIEQASKKHDAFIKGLTTKEKEELRAYTKAIYQELGEHNDRIAQIENELKLLRGVCDHEGDPDTCVHCGQDLYDGI